MFTSWSMADILRWHHHFICRKKSRLGCRVSSLKFIKSVLVLKHVTKTVLIAYFFFSRLKIKSRYISIFFTKVLDIKIPSKLRKLISHLLSWKPYNPTEIHIWSFSNSNSIIEFRERGHMCRHSTVELEIPTWTVKDVKYYHFFYKINF